MHVKAHSLPCLKAPARRPEQRGIALITAVIMLLVITMLAIAGARAALDSKRSSRNQRDFDIALQAAEAALRDAELDIAGTGSRAAMFQQTQDFYFAQGCGTTTATPLPDIGLCDTRSMPAGTNIWDTVDWTATTAQKTVEYGTFTGMTFPTGTGLTPSRKPRYLIEVFPDRPPGGSTAEARFIYRVTAVGFGPNDTTRAMVQMYFRKPMPNS